MYNVKSKRSLIRYVAAQFHTQVPESHIIKMTIKAGDTYYFFGKEVLYTYQLESYIHAESDSISTIKSVEMRKVTVTQEVHIKELFYNRLTLSLLSG